MNRSLALVALLLLGCRPAPAPPQAPTPEPAPACERLVEGAVAGPVCGFSMPATDAAGTPVDAFLGIPYAKDPSGAARWTPPAARAPFTEPFAASAFGPSCPQAVDPGSAGTSEDCLSLNVWRPQGTTPDSALPVLLYIHGGAFTQGGSGLDNRGADGPADDWGSHAYNGAALAATQGVVVVTINYRFGALGFLRARMADGALAGNYGILDQIAAIEWTRRNIAAFGGAPDRITLWGESVGAKSVAIHLVSAAAWGESPPFAGGIVQSNSFPLGTLDPTLAEEVGATFAASLSAPCETVQCLRDAPLDDVLAAQTATQGWMSEESAAQIAATMPFAPVIDGEVLLRDPLTGFAEGRPALPVLLGTTADEGTFFNYANPAPLSPADYRAKLEGTLGPEVAKAALALPRYACDTGDCLSSLSRVMADYDFTCATRYAGRHGGADRYLYDFAYVSTRFTNVPSIELCDDEVCHTAELPYVFQVPRSAWTPGEGTPFDGPFSPAEAALADQIGAWWGRFARAGAPTEDGSWPPATKGVLLIDGGANAPTTTDAAHCADLWDPVLAATWPPTALGETP